MQQPNNGSVIHQQVQQAQLTGESSCSNVGQLVLIPHPVDHELKRRYLALLPPQQILELCLAFDQYAHPDVKRLIWPQDINAAIGTIQAGAPPPSAPAQGSTKIEGEPLMDSLMEPPKNPEDTSIPKSEEPKPPDRTVAAIKTLPPPGYHQPYGPVPNQPAYPHTPYYASSQPWPAYAPYLPHNAYSPPQPSTGYPPHTNPHSQPHAHPPPPHYPHTAHSLLPDPGSHTSQEDLPSYEEMLAEALSETTDPEGSMAPKDLFNWMSQRYPVQQNFRPSASQALQRAFKRGRFEKSASGKYRLNVNFDGGSVGFCVVHCN